MTSNKTADHVINGLVRLAFAVNAEAWARADRQGLSPTQDRVLALLESRGDGKTLTEIAHQLSVTTATASDSVASLVGKGLVRKQADKLDARRKLLVLTAAGHKHAKASMDWSEFLGEAVAKLTPLQQGGLLQALSQILRSLQAGGRIPATRMCVTCRFFRPDEHDDAAHPHHCSLLNVPLANSDLRMDCPEHE